MSNVYQSATMATTLSDPGQIVSLFPSHQRLIMPSLDVVARVQNTTTIDGYHINVNNHALWLFFDQCNNSHYIHELRKLLSTYELIGIFGSKIVPELFDVLSDYLTGDITLEDLPYVIRVIIFMNTDFPELQQLFKRKYILNFDRFTELLLVELSKLLYGKARHYDLSLSEESVIEVCLNSLVIHLSSEIAQYDSKHRLCTGEVQIDCITLLANEMSWLMECNKGENISYEMLRSLHKKLQLFENENARSFIEKAVFYQYDSKQFLGELNPSVEDLILVPVTSSSEMKILAKQIKEFDSRWIFYGKAEDIEGLRPILNIEAEAVNEQLWVLRNFS